MAERINGNGSSSARKEFEFFDPVGRIEVIYGSMFSGKSEELIRRVRRARIAVGLWKDNGLVPEDIDPLNVVQIYKPTVDDRRGSDTVNTLGGDSEPAIPIERIEDLFDHITPNTRVIAIDEAQFFAKEDLKRVVRELARKKDMRVIVAGLVLDFRAEEWGGVGELSWEAEETVKLLALCAKCGSSDGVFTQRVKLIEKDGKTVRIPAHYTDPIEKVGSTQDYESRCGGCVVIPGHPNPIFNKGQR